MHLVQRGSVFTPGPSPGNPYAIQLARYYESLLPVPAKSGNGEQAKAGERLRARPACVFTQLVVLATPCVQRAFHPLDESQGHSSQVLSNREGMDASSKARAVFNDPGFFIRLFCE